MVKIEHTVSSLQQALDRLSCYDDFVASAYRDWCGPRVDLNRVAEKLATDLDTVIQVGLCRRPWASSPTFAGDAEKISIHARLHPDALIEFLREAEALRAFRMGSSGDGLLAAARDHRKSGPAGADSQ